MEKEKGTEKKMKQESGAIIGLDGGTEQTGGIKQTAGTETQEKTPTFQKKIGNTTYTVRVHFDQNSEETFEKKVRRLIINDCLQTAENGHSLKN